MKDYCSLFSITFFPVWVGKMIYKNYLNMKFRKKCSLVFTKWLVEYTVVKSQLMPILEASKVFCQTVHRQLIHLLWAALHKLIQNNRNQVEPLITMPMATPFAHHFSCTRPLEGRSCLWYLQIKIIVFKRVKLEESEICDLEGI